MEHTDNLQNQRSNDKILLRLLFIYITSHLIITSSVLNKINTFQQIPKLISVIFIFICLLNIVFRTKLTLKSIILISIYFIVFIVVSVHLNYFYFTEILIIVVAFKDIEFRDVVKYIFYAQFLSFFSIYILSILGILETNQIIRNNIMRNSLGFWHPNTAMVMYASLFVNYLYVFKDKLNKIYVILLFLFSIYLYKIMDSRTNFLLICSILLFYILFTICSKEVKKIISYISLSLAPIFFIVSYFLSLNYNYSRVAQFLDNIVTGRISLGNIFLNLYGVKFWGQKILYASNNSKESDSVGFNFMVLDNSYLKILLNFGIIFTVLLFVYFLIGVIILIRIKKDYHIALLVIFYSLLAISEQGALSYEINSLFFIGVCIIQYFDKRNKKEIRSGK